MDITNKKILSLLQADARMSATAIGKEICLSRTAVHDRISKMERDGVIVGYTTKINLMENRGIEAVLFVKFSVRPFDPVLQWLQSLAGVSRVLRLAGDLDAVIIANLANTEELSQLNDKIGNDDRVLSTKSHVVISSL